MSKEMEKGREGGREEGEKGWGKEGERECVCVRERERERESKRVREVKERGVVKELYDTSVSFIGCVLKGRRQQLIEKYR